MIYGARCCVHKVYELFQHLMSVFIGSCEISRVDQFVSQEADTVQGYLAHKKQSSTWDHHGALDIVALLRPRGALFLMSEVPLKGRSRCFGKAVLS